MLIVSNRGAYRLVSYGMVVDFEDAVASVTDADVVEVPLRSRRRILKGIATGRPLRRIDPPRTDYDVCLLVAMEPQWVPSLQGVRRFRRVAKHVVVYVFDSWLANLASVRRNRHVWSQIDHVFVSFNHAVEAYQSVLPGSVHYLPQAIEPRWFHPYRESRAIDILSVGRRVAAVHEHLRYLAHDQDLFYYYQTTRSPEAIDLKENQEVLGRLVQASRINVSWAVESTDATRAEGGSPITARWFEAAASGAVVIGARPTNPEFARLFPLDGFVRELSPRATRRDVEKVVSSAFAEGPATEDRIRLAEHVRGEHTWSRRWTEMLASMGIADEPQAQSARPPEQVGVEELDS